MNIKANLMQAGLTLKKYSPWICAGASGLSTLGAVVCTYMGKDDFDNAVDNLPEKPKTKDILKTLNPWIIGAAACTVSAVVLPFVGVKLTWDRLEEAYDILETTSVAGAKAKQALMAAAGASAVAAAQKEEVEKQVEQNDIQVAPGMMLVYDEDHNYVFACDAAKFARGINWAQNVLNYNDDGYYINRDYGRGYLPTDELYHKFGVAPPHGDDVLYYGKNDGIVINDKMVNDWGTGYVSLYADEEVTLDNGQVATLMRFWPEPTYHKGLEYVYVDEQMVFDEYPEDEQH